MQNAIDVAGQLLNTISAARNELCAKVDLLVNAISAHVETIKDQKIADEARAADRAEALRQVIDKGLQEQVRQIEARTEIQVATLQGYQHQLREVCAKVRGQEEPDPPQVAAVVHELEAILDAHEKDLGHDLTEKIGHMDGSLPPRPVRHEGLPPRLPLAAGLPPRPFKADDADG